MNKHQNMSKSNNWKTIENYRVPSLDEFILGFEYEVYSEGCFDDGIEDYCGWYEYQFGQGDCWRDIEDIKRELANGNIRAKANKN